MEKKPGYYIVVASVATSIVITLLFYILGMQTNPAEYTSVDIYAGMVYVFILSMIVSASIYAKVLNRNGKVVYLISLSIIVFTAFYFGYAALVATSSLNLENGEYEVKGSIIYVHSNNVITLKQEEIPGVMPAKIAVYDLDNLNGIRISDFAEGDDVSLILRQDLKNLNFALIHITNLNGGIKWKNNSANKSVITRMT